MSPVAPCVTADDPHHFPGSLFHIWNVGGLDRSICRGPPSGDSVRQRKTEGVALHSRPSSACPALRGSQRPASNSTSHSNSELPWCACVLDSAAFLSPVAGSGYRVDTHESLQGEGFGRGEKTSQEELWQRCHTETPVYRHHLSSNFSRSGPVSDPRGTKTQEGSSLTSTAHNLTDGRHLLCTLT